jgi:hypothetical protein
MSQKYPIPMVFKSLSEEIIAKGKAGRVSSLKEVCRRSARSAQKTAKKVIRAVGTM